jgi:hypothetical protein
MVNLGPFRLPDVWHVKDGDPICAETTFIYPDWGALKVSVLLYYYHDHPDRVFAFTQPVFRPPSDPIAMAPQGTSVSEALSVLISFVETCPEAPRPSAYGLTPLMRNLIIGALNALVDQQRALESTQ